jgi:hypothetical protein
VYISKGSQVSTLGVKIYETKILYTNEIKFTCENGIQKNLINWPLAHIYQWQEFNELITICAFVAKGE